MSHPEAGELVDLARQILGEADERHVRQHLEDCARCRRAFERLSILVTVARGAAPPADVVRRVETLGAAPLKRTDLLRARAIFDNLLEPLPAGMRGTVRDRHLLFEAGDWTVDVRLDREPGRTALTGQLAHALSSRSCSGIAVLARSEETVVARALTGAWGEFTLDCGDCSPLTVEVLVPAPAIAIDLPQRD
jgi:hypothetical protein